MKSLQGSASQRDLRRVLAAMGLNVIPLGYTLVVLPIYLNEIGFSEGTVGAITAMSAIANTFARVPSALAADRYGRKFFAVGGFLCAALSYLLFASTTDLNVLLLASAVGGVGIAGGFSSALWVPVSAALVADKAPSGSRAKAFAWSQGVWTLSLSAGSALSIIPTIFRGTFQIPYVKSFQYVFLIFSALTILSALIVSHLTELRADRAAPKTRTSRRLPQSLRQIAKFSLTTSLLGFAQGVSLQLLSLWFKKTYAVNEAAVGPWFAAAQLTAIIAVPIIPRLAERWGSVLSVLATEGLGAVVLGSMVLAPTYQAAGMIFVARNIFMNISWSLQQSYLMGTVAIEERASAFAISLTTLGIGRSISPMLAGYFLGGSGFLSISAPLLIGAAVYLTSAITFFLLFRGVLPREETSAIKTK